MKDALQTAAQEVRPSAHMDYRAWLAALFAHVKEASGHYSYQRFAQDMGFGATTVLHQVVRGHRPLSAKAAGQISQRLGLPPEEKAMLLALVEHGNAASAAARRKSFDALLALKKASLPDGIDQDSLAYFSDWRHPVVRELVALPDFREDAAWIAQRVRPKIKPEQAQQSLDLLLRLGVIVRDPDTGRLRQTTVRVATDHRVRGLGVVSYHQQMLDRARDALTAIEGKRRDISAMTLTVDEETAQRLKAMIHEFQKALMDAAEASPGGDQVYQVNIQMFPFTA